MHTERGVVFGVVGLVLVTTLISGPLVASVDFTTAPERSSFGDGNATIGEVSLPASAEITDGRYGSGGHYLRVPDATVELEAISGQPLLAYRLSIDELGYSRSTTHFISDSNTGPYTLTLARDSVDSSTLTRDSYSGTLSILLRSNGTERQIASQEITIEVDE